MGDVLSDVAVLQPIHAVLHRRQSVVSRSVIILEVKGTVSRHEPLPPHKHNQGVQGNDPVGIIILPSLESKPIQSTPTPPSTLPTRAPVRRTSHDFSQTALNLVESAMSLGSNAPSWSKPTISTKCLLFSSVI